MPFLGSSPANSSIASPIATLSDTQVLGSGAEEDVKITFDGNAVDYHIGMDDSGDTLNFGKDNFNFWNNSRQKDVNCCASGACCSRRSSC